MAPHLELLSHTAMKGATVLLVALLLGLILRKTAASRRYAIWITAIAALAVLPLAMWALPAWRVLPKAAAESEWPVFEPELRIDSAEAIRVPAGQRVTSSVAKPEQQAPGPVNTPSSFSWKISWQDVVSQLPLAWMLIAGCFLLRLGLSAWRLRRLEATLTRGEFAMVAQAARELGLKRLPRLFIGPADAVPMVWGVFRPRLLLPQGFESWSHEKQRGVLLHELAHLKRGDPLALWTAQWVKALHWFNPLAWLTLRQLRADQERACDDTVLRQGVRASDYAQSLLDLSRHNRLAPGLSLCALTITRCAPVEARVKAILDPTRRREVLTLRWLAGLCGCALLITLPVAMLHAIEGPTLRGRILDRNGVVLAESTKEKVRNYPLKTVAAHMIGYVRPPDEKHSQFYGGSGLEKQQNATLTAGKDATLTLDMRIQSLAYQAMKDAGVTRGAAVVLDPRTGEILASVSLPSFDLNLLVPSISQENWDNYLSNRDIPLLNRCLGRPCSPGDAFTPLTALAAISKGLGDKMFFCKPSTTSYTSKFACLQIRQGGQGHGEMGLEQALQNSCRHYWCQIGMLAGFDAFGKLGKNIGFGQHYDLLDAELPGVLPTQEWWEKRRQGKAAWSEVDTASLAEGYGYLNVTPMQMCVLVATIANSGKIPQPVLNKTTRAVWRADLIAEGLPAAQIENLREGMRLAVNGDSATGRSARSDEVMISGKIALAQNWRIVGGQRVEDNLSWFLGFAPFDKPSLAFAILKEGGKNAEDCAPIAKRIVEEALALPADGSGEVKPVSDEVGRAHEELMQAQAQFDASAALLKATIERIKPDPTTGFSLNGFAVHDGQLSLHGKASGMIQALQFREKLVHLELLKHLDWTFPVPSTMDDGKSVYFSWWGVTRLTESKDKTAEAATPSKPSDQAQTRQQSDAEIRMKPALAKQWSALKQAGLLADLPAEAMPFDLGGMHPERQVKSVRDFRFRVTREAARRWLLESHCQPARGDSLSPLPGSLASALTQPAVEDMAADWPVSPQPFRRTYMAANDCQITIHASDGEHVLVTVTQMKRSILIAPDEATPPAPKTAAPKELSGVAGNDIHPASETGQGQLDFDAAEISRQIRVLAKKKGIEMSRLKAGHSVISIVGVSDGMDEVLLFRDELIKLGKQWQVTWEVTTPRQVPDRPKTMFMAVGIYKKAPIKIVTPAAIASSAKDWDVLQKFGKLADLPAGAVPDKLTHSESFTTPSVPTLQFAFTASREAVHEWLTASVPANKLEPQADKLRELGGTKPFGHDFWIQDNCWVRVECAMARVRVLVYRRNMILIAPDESQEPRPAGKLAPEYKRDGLTLTAPPASSFHRG